MLTIGELAEITGVTTRAVRHYHRTGVLPEPDRRLNNYRSYGPLDVIRLVKIRRMQELGLKLDEIRKLLVDEDPVGLRDALTILDEELAREQAEIDRRRTRIAALLAGGGSSLALPAELAEIVDGMAAAGAVGVELERDALALLVALHPERVGELVETQRRLVAAAGDGAAEVSRRFAALAALDPDDPRVPQTAELIAGLVRKALPDGVTRGAAAPPHQAALIEVYFGQALSPAQNRCAELVVQLAAAPADPAVRQ